MIVSLGRFRYRILRSLRHAILVILVQGVAFRNRNSRFANLWRIVARYPVLLRLPKAAIGPFPEFWRNKNRLYVDCLEVMQWAHPDDFPVVRCDDIKPLLEAVARREKIVFIALHSDISTAFYPVLVANGLPFSVIAIPSLHSKLGIPKLQRTAKKFGFLGDLSIIPNDANCFLNARRRLVEGSIICCAPDRFELFDKQPNRIVVEASLFEFCRRLKTTVFYTIPSIQPDGAITINLSGPHRYDSDHDIGKAIDHFMQYAAAVIGTALSFDVVKLPYSAGHNPAVVSNPL